MQKIGRGGQIAQARLGFGYVGLILEPYAVLTMDYLQTYPFVWVWVHRKG